ncbi:MAG: right-handed parallel beta-helix repeat-containing protein, partial [Halanaeroarchaeum sp.]
MNQYAHAVFVALLVGGLTVASTTAPVVGASGGGEAGVTFVESDVTTNTTWTPEDGPYRVIQDIGVERGATLTVTPGTEVQFADGKTITVAGSMATAGTESRPVTLETTPGASAAARWGGLRYEGGADSSLTLANTTIDDAENGLTVASEAGRVSLRDVTITEIGRHGIAVDDVSTMPETTVERSTVAETGGHAIAATPRAGTLDAISLDPVDTERGKQTRHTLRMATGVEATVDEIELVYGGHGNASSVDADAIEQFGVDRDDEGDVDRTWTDRIENVTADGDRIRVTLTESVRLRGDDELVLSVSEVSNPETRGIYRVDVRLTDRGVSQLSGGVHAPLVVGDVPTEHADTSVVGETSVESLSVRDSRFQGIEGAGLFVDADVVDVDLRNNRIGAVQGDGIAIRAGSLAGTVRANDVTAGDAGVHLAVRDGVDRLRVVDNAVTESDAGLRIRQSGSRVRASVGATVDRNTFANNTGDGIDAKTDRGRLTGFSLADNVLRDNGGAGASLSHDAIGAGTVADNRVVGNGGDGISIRTRSVTGTDLVANTLAENGGDGLDLRTATSVRDVEVRNATVRDNEGHGLAIATDLVVHEVGVDGGVISNNAGAGLLVRSPLT